MEEEEVPHTPPQEEGNEGEAPHQPEEAEPEDLKSSISPKRTIRIKKKIHKPEKEEESEEKVRMKTVVIAKKYVKEIEDGEPLPGSVEEDLAMNIDEFFEIKEDRLTNPNAYKPKQDENGKVIAWSIAGSTDIFERMREEEKLESELGDRRGSNSLHGRRTAGKKKGALKSDKGSKTPQNRKCKDVTDEELLVMFQNIEERLFHEQAAEADRGARISFKEKLKTAKDERVLDNYLKFQKAWDRQSKLAQDKTKREEIDSLVNSSEGYREKNEKLTALELATPSSIKYGSQNFNLSLRSSEYHNDLRHHMIQMGNLWVRVTENPNAKADIIRNPNLLKNINKKTFKDNPYLKEKERKEKKRLDEILPGKDDEIDGLQVQGISKFREEFETFSNMEGAKELVLDHYINSDGEGEPDLDEEIIAMQYDKNKDF